MSNGVKLAAVPQQRPWREYITDIEDLALAHLESRAADLDAQRKIVTQEMNLIRNRACQRARYADRK